MAKGQKRSSREIRKPKKEKVAPKADTPFGSQVKQTGNPSAVRSGGGK